MANTVFKDHLGDIMLVTTNKKLFDGINDGRLYPVIEGIEIQNMKYKEVDNYKRYHNNLRERIKNDERCELLESLCTFIKTKDNGKRKNEINS